MKKFRKVIAFTLVLVSLMSVNITANAVGNVKNTTIEIEAKRNFNGNSQRSSWRKNLTIHPFGVKIQKVPEENYLLG